MSGLPGLPCTHPCQISLAIRDGAEGYFATQYGTIARLSGGLCAAIFLVYLFRRETAEQQAAGVNRVTLALLTAVSFILAPPAPRPRDTRVGGWVGVVPRGQACCTWDGTGREGWRSTAGTRWCIAAVRWLCLPACLLGHIRSKASPLAPPRPQACGSLFGPTCAWRARRGGRPGKRWWWRCVRAASPASLWSAWWVPRRSTAAAGSRWPQQAA